MIRKILQISLAVVLLTSLALFWSRTLPLSSDSTMQAPTSSEPAARTEVAETTVKISKNLEVEPQKSLDRQASAPPLRKELVEFSDWMARRKTADGALNCTEAQGLRLAKARRDALLAMIQNHEIPDDACFVRPVDRQNLPASILATLEKPVSELGEFRSWSVSGVVCDHGANAACQHRRGLEIELANGQTYSVLGKQIPPMIEAHGKLPVRGYEVGGTFVMAEHPLRVLDKGETVPMGVDVKAAVNHTTSEPPEKESAATGDNLPLVAEIGGEFVSFTSEETLTNYRVAYSYEGWGGTGSAATSTFSTIPRAINNNQVGRFRALYISVSYSDEPWAHVTEAEAEQNCRLAQQAWNEFSYGKMKAEFVIAPPIVLPFARAATNLGKGETAYIPYWTRVEACKLGYDYREFNTTYMVLSRWGGGIAAIGGD